MVANHADMVTNGNVLVASYLITMLVGVASSVNLSKERRRHLALSLLHASSQTCTCLPKVQIKHQNHTFHQRTTKLLIPLLLTQRELGNQTWLIW
ncbi:hypothetical protein HDK90DRAFT_336362 [Phyllosticta capitalensis]|uniref:Uncharacterized protein n=1 Tax=Phyllosticta capitalensis TaxID=121624 RepID=A0ABR1YGL4_9PEZI